jgi:hypothetical protein
MLRIAAKIDDALFNKLKVKFFKTQTTHYEWYIGGGMDVTQFYRRSTYSEWMEHGMCTIYNNKNKITRSTPYILGKRHGISIKYDERGLLETHYYNDVNILDNYVCYEHPTRFDHQAIRVNEDKHMHISYNYMDNDTLKNLDYCWIYDNGGMVNMCHRGGKLCDLSRDIVG